MIILKLSEMRMPKFGALHFREVIRDDMKLINKIANYSINAKLLKFSIHGKTVVDSPAILKMCTNLTDSFTLSNCTVEKDYVAKIIESCSQAKKVIFKDCIYKGQSIFEVRFTLVFQIQK